MLRARRADILLSHPNIPPSSPYSFSLFLHSWIFLSENNITPKVMSPLYSLSHHPSSASTPWSTYLFWRSHKGTTHWLFDLGRSLSFLIFNMRITWATVIFQSPDLVMSTPLKTWTSSLLSIKLKLISTVFGTFPNLSLSHVFPISRPTSSPYNLFANHVGLLVIHPSDTPGTRCQFASVQTVLCLDALPLLSLIKSFPSFRNHWNAISSLKTSSVPQSKLTIPPLLYL